MGKSDFLTPKAIANRIKAKGLQKLRWYCQMCQKQCRDENGFKCHCMSESHQRQMQVFGQNPHRIVDGFSEEFQEGFMDLLKRSHRFSRIAATVVYNEYINDRHHVHMNSTKWATLTEFIKHLGRAGLCKVEDTPKGWFITYIDRDSETIFKDRLKQKRLKADLVDEERQEKAIQAQIEKAQLEMGPQVDGQQSQQLEASISQPQLEGPSKVAFLLQGNLGEAKGGNKRAKLGFEEELEASSSKVLEASSKKGLEASSKSSVLDELMKEEEKKKERVNRKDYWLCEGIIVKVMSKSLADKGYYKQKGIVKRVIEKYTGEIEMIENKHKLRVDQAELETVIPQVGGLVRIVNGAYRGSNAKLLAVDTRKFCAKVQIEKGVYDGRVLKEVEYEDICKVG